MKACPTHGPIEMTGLECPACGADLEYFADAIEYALSLDPEPMPQFADYGPLFEIRNPKQT